MVIITCMLYVVTALIVFAVVQKACAMRGKRISEDLLLIIALFWPVWGDSDQRRRHSVSVVQNRPLHCEGASTCIVFQTSG